MLGSVGGFVTGSGPLVDLIINRALFVHFHDRPGARGRRRGPGRAPGAEVRGREALLGRSLAALTDRLRGHPSPIIPVLLGDESAAVAASRALLARRAAGARYPAADRASRHLPPARGAVGRAQ